MEKPVIIFGAEGLAEAAIEIFNSHQIVVYGILDDKKELHGNEIHDISVLGDTSDQGFLKFIGKKCDAFLATDDMLLRKNLVKMLKEKRKVMPMNAIHDKATVSDYAELHHGIFINMGSRIGAGAVVNNHCLINYNSIIEHKSVLGEFVQVGSGSIIGSGCKIGEGVFIGAGSTLVPGIQVGKNARIGAGSVVVEDIDEGSTVFGNPAKKVEL